MIKAEIIERYGKEEHEKRLQRAQEWRANNQERSKQTGREWRESHPEQVKAFNQEQNRKGGKRYEKRKAHKMQGIPHEKELVRGKHHRIWTPYKKIIAPESVMHHEWIPETADYRGVALVEKDQHQYGRIGVIQILGGEITLLTESEVMRGEGECEKEHN